MVDTRLRYETGLDRHYGLLDLALKHGIFKQVSTRIELPDGSKQYSKTIQNEPEKYFTKEIMEQLEENLLKKNFLMDPQTRFSKVKYRYVQHVRYEHDLILIDEGQFKDVQYVYGNVKFIEEEGQLRIKFDYTVILNPNDCDTESKEFIDVIGTQYYMRIYNWR